MFHNRLLNSLAAAALLVIAGLTLRMAMASSQLRANARTNTLAQSLYFESERRGIATPVPVAAASFAGLRLSADGLAIYHQSEWSRVATPAVVAAAGAPALTGVLRLSAEGLAVYHESEWGRTAADLASAGLEQGMAIYHASEQGSATARLTAQGLAVYHVSEWGRVPDRAQRFNAYQRSEWLGADR